MRAYFEELILIAAAALCLFVLTAWYGEARACGEYPLPQPPPIETRGMP